MEFLSYNTITFVYKKSSNPGTIIFFAILMDKKINVYNQFLFIIITPV